MRGLRTQEGKKFERFFSHVQKKANDEGRVFFLDFGDCRDEEFGDMLIDDLCGWLVPVGGADQFERVFLSDGNLERWDDDITWCISSVKDGNLNIQFEQFKH